MQVLIQAGHVHSFDKGYWDRHWHDVADAPPDRHTHPNPYVARAVDGVTPGTALDAGCGSGTEAVWLAAQGWQVTGADISGRALATAAERAHAESVDERVTWIEADLTTWQPQQRWDLVMTNYAHPAMPQLAFYQRIAEWVRLGGSLLIVGHRHDPSSGAHRHEVDPPDEATVDLAAITALLGSDSWRVDIAEEHTRPLPASRGHAALHDVVVLATRVA